MPPSDTPARDTDDLGLDLDPGDAQYRAYVGPPEDYDLIAAMSFGLLTAAGMRQHHRVLDIGCGSLRVGRLLLPYLNAGGYTGLEPNRWLVAEGIRREVGQDQVAIKQPRFVYDTDATALLAEGRRYDYVVAQSIFSHCGPDLMAHWVSQVAELLAEGGVLLATYVHDDADSAASGWIYPDCVGYTPAALERVARDHCLGFAALDWRHPRQRWVAMVRGAVDPAWQAQGGLSWNASFERYNARRQPG